MPTKKIEILVEPLRKLLRRGATGRVMNMLKKIHYADIALLMQLLNNNEQIMIFRIMAENDVSLTADVLSEMAPEKGVELLAGLERETVVRIFSELYSDDAAVLMEKLPDEIQEELIGLMEAEDSEELQGLLQHPKETAGRIMSPNCFALPEETSVDEAIKALHTTVDVEMAFYLYVVDERGHLVGVVSLRQLILQPPHKKLKDIMTTEVISIKTNVDQEEVARIVARYDILALPVVDEENRLVGIVTVDDVIDIMRREATEDILKIAGTGEQELRTISLFKTLRSRIPLLFATWAGGIIAYYLILLFEDTLSRVIILAGFIPLLIGMGGAVGTQSSTVMVRLLSTSDFYLRRFLTMIWKEMGAALLLGVIYSVLLGGFICLVNLYHPGSGWNFVFMVCLALLLSMLSAAVIGILLPLLFNKLHMDPAVAVTPFVTTLINCVILVIYFFLARVLLV